MADNLRSKLDTRKLERELVIDEPEEYTIPEIVRDVVLGGASGAAMGAAFGPGAAIGGAAGAIAGPVSEYSARQVGHRYGPLAGVGAGFLSDLIVSGGVRGAARAASPSARALKHVRGMGLQGLTGAEGPGDVIAGVRSGYAGMESAERQAWNAARQANVDIAGDPSPVIDTALDISRRHRLTPHDVPEMAHNIPGVLDEAGMNVDQAQEVLRAASQTQRRAAANPELAVQGMEAGRIKRAVDEVLDEIEEAGGGGVAELRRARAASAAKHAAAPYKSATYKMAIGEQSLDEPTKALQRIIQSRQPVQEVQRIKSLIGNNQAARKGLERAAIQRLTGTIMGGTGATRPRTYGAAVERLHAEERVFRELFGDARYHAIEKFLSDAHRKQSGPAGRLMRYLSQGGPLAGGTATASTLYAAGAPPKVAAGVGGGLVLAGTVGEGVRRIYGPNAVRALAYEAIVNPDVMRKLMRKAGGQESEALAQRLMDSAVRRGILSLDDVQEWMSGAPGRERNE